MTFKLKLKPRKIISMSYSFLITLPQGWLFAHRIGKGATVNLRIADNGDLILFPNKNRRE